MLDGMPRFEVAQDDSLYPELLRQTKNPPSVLYGLGDPEALKAGLGVVGARRATPYGRAATRILAGWAASEGYTIVSGGALGYDQAAHSVALEHDAPTVAVMGGGADVCYPRRSEGLFERIAATGAVISEQPWGTQPLPWMFRLRNRIIAGLCPILLVVEAGLPSGTFSTAEYALDEGRTLAVVPGSIFAPESRGSNRLIASGAQPVCDASELAQLVVGEALMATPLSPPALEGVSSQCSPVVRALMADPMRPDDIARELGIDIVAVARQLGRLEAQGVVARYPDGRYGPC